MDKNELERRLEAAEKQILGLLDEIKNLKAKLAEMQDEPEIPDFPEFVIGKDYYYSHIRWKSNPLRLSTERCDTKYCKKPGIVEMDYFNFHSIEYYNCFEKKCKLIAMMLHCKWYLDRDYVPDWKNNEEYKYFVFYNNNNNANEFGVTVRTTSDVGYVAFSTEEKARKCADWLNKHWKENADE